MNICILLCLVGFLLTLNLGDVAGCVTIEMGTQKIPHSAQQGCLPCLVLKNSVILKKHLRPSQIGSNQLVV